MGRLERVADTPRQSGLARDLAPSPKTEHTGKLAGFLDLRAARLPFRRESESKTRGRSAKGELVGQSSGKGIPGSKTCCVIWVVFTGNYL